MKTCAQLIVEFNIAASIIPPQIRDKILNGEVITVAECEDRVEEVKTAAALWGEILKRVSEFNHIKTQLQ